MSKFSAQRKIKKVIPQKPKTFPGQLGDGYGNLHVDDMPGYIYCRIGGRAEKIFNDRVPEEYDKFVEVGLDKPLSEGGIYRVVSSRTYSPGGNGSLTQMGFAPAKRYEIFAQGGGEDPLWVHLRAFTPLRVGPVFGWTIAIQKGVIDNGTNKVWVPFQLADLASYLPTTTDKAALVLCTVNTSGVLVTTKGAEFTLSTVTDLNDMLIHLPANPAGTVYVSAAIRVYEGQIAILEGRDQYTDVVDLRFSGSQSPVLPILDANRVVMTNGSGVMGTDAELLWDGTNKIFTIGKTPPVTATAYTDNLVPADSVSAARVTWGFGARPNLYFMRSQGTRTVPLVMTNDLSLAFIEAWGYDGLYYIEAAALRAVTTEDWDGNAPKTGAGWDMYMTPTGTGDFDKYIQFRSDGINLIDPAAQFMVNGTPISGGGGGAFQRNLAADLTLADGESLVVSGYIATEYDLMLDGDSVLELL